MNWEERIKRAIKAKRFTDEDLKLASLWTTCPISEFADQIELRDGNLAKGPTDIYLLLDGIFFTKGIEDGNVDLAKHCYYAIVEQVKALQNGTDRMSNLKRFLGEK